MLLESKRAIVSGVGDGLGRSLALALAREGADVVLGARRERHLRTVAAEIEAMGRRAWWLSTDITDQAQCDALTDLAVGEMGGVDILINNAFHPGVRGGNVYDDDYDGSAPIWAPILDSDLDGVWREAMETNFFGTMRLTRAVAPHMVARGDGRIVMVNTQTSLWIKPTHGTYAASKGALATVTKTLATELGPHGIRVNGIHPGFIWGPPLQRALQAAADRAGTTLEEVVAGVTAEIPLGYMPPSEEVADAAIFFASDLARAITGQSLAVNGGHYLP